LNKVCTARHLFVHFVNGVYNASFSSWTSRLRQRTASARQARVMWLAVPKASQGPPPSVPLT